MEIPDIYKTTSLIGARLLCLLLMVFTSGCEKKTGDKAKELVFKLDEVSAFEVIGQSASFVRGQRGECSSEPDMSVKAWPAFKSDKRLYGSVWFAGEYAEKNSGIQYHFALDESAGTAKGYDRVYFDLNRDLDLTNDAPVAPQKKPPDNAMLDYSWIEQQVCFDYLYVDFDFGPDGKRSLEIMPRLTISDSGYSVLSFVATKVRKGKCKIAGQGYDVLLGHTFSIGGRFDLPATALYMIPKGDFKHQPSWWCAELLMAMHKIKGQYYRFSSTLTGDQLIVRPYNGEFGTFKIGSGGRAIWTKKAKGSLRSKDATVAVGGKIEDRWPQAARSCRLPVGDYLPNLLTINFGDLRISVSDNYHSEGKLRDRGDRPYVYGIKIRKDKPFSLDFSNEPEVMFVSPVRDHRVTPGEELVVKAILTDPKLDIMIRGLDVEQSSGGISSWLALNPKVIITRADGEVVAEGVMPFG